MHHHTTYRTQGWPVGPPAPGTRPSGPSRVRRVALQLGRVTARRRHDPTEDEARS